MANTRGPRDKIIDAYAEGHDGRAESHYESAVESYDRALELIG